VVAPGILSKAAIAVCAVATVALGVFPQPLLDLADHAAHLLVHGVLHLLGYDHDTEADAALMEPVETKILARLGVADPYVEEPGAQ
jgi:probable rRNA maturation factor